MVTVFAKHTVENYDTWKAAWDGMASTHQKYGATGNYRLFQEAGNPNEVVIMNEWESMEGIERFMEEVDIDEEMDNSGVLGEPELYFLEEIESKTPERPLA